MDESFLNMINLIYLNLIKYYDIFLLFYQKNFHDSDIFGFIY